MTGIGKKRLWLLLLAVAAVVALVVLAAGFRDVELSQGQFLPRYRDAEEIFYTEGVPLAIPFVGELFAGLFFFAVLLFPFSIIYLVISPSARRYVLRGLGLLMPLIALFILLRVQPAFFEQLQQQSSQQPPVFDPKIRDVEFAANPPQWLIWMFTVTVAILLAWGIITAVIYVWRRTRLPERTLEQLAQEAQDALDALQAGADLKDTVMRCYFEMNQVVREQKGLVREETMTTREFEAYLVEAGLPDQQVQQLTRLFEDVRYGTRSAAGHDEQQAIGCLTAIVESCRSST